MLTRRWLLLPLAAVLIASHSLVLRYALHHKSLSAAIVTGIVILVVMTHLGLLSRFFTFLPAAISAMKCRSSRKAISYSTLQ